jgi:hypothetical protein
VAKSRASRRRGWEVGITTTYTSPCFQAFAVLTRKLLKKIAFSALKVPLVRSRDYWQN